MPAKKKAAHFHPYARGFRAPNVTRRQLAIGNSSDTAFQPIDTFFQPIPKPKCEDDWLAQYNEEGQTFSDFLKQTPLLGKRKMKGMKGDFFAQEKHISERYPGKSICILPVGDFPASKSPQLEHLKQYTESFFCIDVTILPTVELTVTPTRASISFNNSHHLAGMKVSERHQNLSHRYHKENGYYQLHATTLLQKLRASANEDAICTIAVTMSDLFDDKSDLFLAGWAAGNARVGCFSFKRYNPQVTFSSEFWYDVKVPAKKKTTPGQYAVLLGRCCRLLVHEVAHLLGVDHCIFFACCMNGSGHLQEDFSQPMHLCPVDLHKLQHLCGFDVGRRYGKLLEFYWQHGMQEEATWIAARIDYLQE